MFFVSNYDKKLKLNLMCNYIALKFVSSNDASLQTRRQRGKTLLTTLWGRKVWLCLASVQPELTGGAVQANVKKIN